VSGGKTNFADYVARSSLSGGDDESFDVEIVGE
jgi:hypothetical protein